jgi:HSP20 family protein
MALVRWAPARSAYPEINRLFNTLFDSSTPLSPGLGVSRVLEPATDIVEFADEFVLRTDLPGVREQDVKLEILDGVLTLSGERAGEKEQSGEGYRRIERFAGSFKRTLRLPKGVDAEAVQATFENGVLEIHVPKPAAARPHTVEISVGDGASEQAELAA